MQIKYVCTHWGSEKEEANEFINKVLGYGYNGIEINLSSTSKRFEASFLSSIEEIRNTNKDFVLIAQQLTTPNNESVDSYIKRMEASLLELAGYQPNFINSHTGKDYYSFADNCKVIEAALNISSKTGVRILHETHRGRFSFHAATLLPYLKLFPELELVGDFSHFCTVSESLLQDQEAIIQEIIPHVSHIHARIGHEHSPQVNDPAAPEWQNHFNWFVAWWQEIILYQQEKGKQQLTITPEHGPFPYMPEAPYSKLPLSEQWENNLYIMNQLKTLID